MGAGEDILGDDYLVSLLESPDLLVLDAWLSDADEAQVRHAAAWHRAHKAALDEFRSDEAWEVHRARTWSGSLLIAAGAPPAEAAKTLPWNDWWFVRDHERDLLVRALLRRPRAWAERFVPSAAQVKLGRRRESATAPFLFVVLDSLIRAHDLPVPEGDAFLDGWARFDPTDDPYLRSLLPALLRSSHLRHRPGLPEAAAAKVTCGEIAREDVVGAALEALVAPLPPSAQRVLADLLARLGLTAEDVAGRLPLLQNALATGHGSITAVLLPIAMSLAAEAADVDQIAAVVAGRAEKRQRVVLLDLLAGRDLRERVGVEAVLGALAHLDACDDAALHERAARVRRTMVDAPEVEATEPSSAYGDLWAPLVRHCPPAVEPLHPPAALDLAACYQLLGPVPSPELAAKAGRINRTGHAVLLDCVVRAAAAGRASLSSWLPAHGSGMWPIEPVPAAIRCWLRGDLDNGPIYDPEIPGRFAGAAPSWRPRQYMVNAAAREALWRAGRVSTVLSTPSHTDGTLHLDVLLSRIEPRQVISYTPYDLAQALLRLPPVSSLDVDRMSGLDDLRLPADPDCWAEHARNHRSPDAPPFDGVDLIRRWVGEGGMRPLDASWRLVEGAGPYGGMGWDWGDDGPPLPVSVLDSLLVGIAGLADFTATPAAITLAPCWPDLAAAGLVGEQRTDTRSDVIVESPGPLGTPSHAAVLAPIAGPPEDQRRGVLALLELVGREALSDPHLRSAVDVLNRAGRLPLARVAQGLEQAFVAGALADLWSAALGITADAARRRPLPSGLPDLLRLLTAYLPAVPDRHLPAELIELAAARGSTKSHAEARALLALRGAS